MHTNILGEIYLSLRLLCDIIFFIYSIEELVQEGENGCLFSNSNELVNCFTDLLANFPKCKKIENFSSNLKNEFRKSNWNANFQRNALPIFNN